MHGNGSTRRSERTSKSVFASVRLAIAGYVSVALLIWIGFVPGAVVPLFSQYAPGLFAALGSAGLSTLILVILFPVYFRGTGRDRWLAGLISAFPLIIL